MKYIPQKDDNVPTTIRMPKRVRRKLGMLVDKNTTLPKYLEKMCDKELKKR